MDNVAVEAALFPVQLLEVLSSGGTNYYSWIEATADPTSGQLEALIGGRQGSPTNCPAVEVNNAVVSVPSFAWLRLRGGVAGQLLYEFLAPGTSQVFAAQVTAVALDASHQTVSITGTTTSGSATVTSVSSTVDLQLGMVVTGTGIPSGTTITGSTSSTLTLSQQATASGSPTITAALYLYTWAEQMVDATSGALVPLGGGRTGSPAGNPALEVNNVNLTVPFYCWMRERGNVNTAPEYDFQAPNTGALVVYTGSEVVAVATANIASLSGVPAAQDGITLAAGQRILLSAQSTASQNGPWVVQGGAWTRPTEYASGSVVYPGYTVFVAFGTTYAHTAWLMTAASGQGAVTVDATSSTWTQLAFPTPDASHTVDGTVNLVSGQVLGAGDKFISNRLGIGEQSATWGNEVLQVQGNTSSKYTAIIKDSANASLELFVGASAYCWFAYDGVTWGEWYNGTNYLDIYGAASNTSPKGNTQPFWQFRISDSSHSNLANFSLWGDGGVDSNSYFSVNGTPGITGTAGINATVKGGIIMAAGSALAAGTGINVSGGTVSVAGTIPQSETVQVQDSGTTNAPAALTVSHSTSGTPANGFGVGLVFQADDSSAATVSLATLVARWGK